MRDDLGFLRKNVGFTQAHLDQTPAIMELLRAEPGESFERSRSRFVSALHSLDAEEADLLLDVFALSPATKGVGSLSERRRIHGKSIGRGIDTVAAREKVALDHLTSRLIRGTYAQSPLALQVPEMHNGLVYEETSTLIVVKDRRWLETIERYRFVAAFDEMDFVRVPRTYVARVSTPADGSFQVVTRSSPNGETDEFWHLEAPGGSRAPMFRGIAYDLRFKLEPAEAQSRNSPLRLISRAFHERSLLASIRVKFLGEVPRVLWMHERMSFVEMPGFPSASNIQTLDEQGSATLRLRDVYGGLQSGFAWEFE